MSLNHLLALAAAATVVAMSSAMGLHRKVGEGLSRAGAEVAFTVAKPAGLQIGRAAEHVLKLLGEPTNR